MNLVLLESRLVEQLARRHIRGFARFDESEVGKTRLRLAILVKLQMKTWAALPSGEENVQTLMDKVWWRIAEAKTAKPFRVKTEAARLKRLLGGRRHDS